MLLFTVVCCWITLNGCIHWLFESRVLAPAAAVFVNVPNDLVRVLQNESLYNKHATPTQDLDLPVNVTISMYIEGLSSFQAQTMDFHVDIYFQEVWVDARLQHAGKNRILIKDTKLFELMWHPDLYFANARQADYHEVTAPNFLVWIYPNGTIYFDTRISLDVMCMMDLSKYPLDTQRCSIRILSYAYTDAQLVLGWRPASVDVNKGIKLPDMHLASIIADLCPGVYELGNWSCAQALFVVQRQMMHHILQSYIPTALIVVISWFSFWLDVDSVPGRVSLCITTLLTLATQASAARLALPQVSYIKAIDVWMGTCLAFVFGVMIEFTFVNYLSRRKPPAVSVATMCRGHSVVSELDHTTVPAIPIRGQLTEPGTFIRKRSPASYPVINDLKSPLTPDSKYFQPPTELCAPESIESLRLLCRQKNRKIAQSIDRYCRTAFPVMFSVFNIVYWLYYTFLPDPDPNAIA